MNEALYPLSLASAHPGVFIKPIPMIGVIDLALADVLRDLPKSSVSTVLAVSFYVVVLHL